MVTHLTYWTSKTSNNNSSKSNNNNNSHKKHQFGNLKTIHICSAANRFRPQFVVLFFLSLYYNLCSFSYSVRSFVYSCFSASIRFQTANERTNDNDDVDIDDDDTSFQSAHWSVKLFFHDQYFFSICLSFFEAHLYVNIECYTTIYIHIWNIQTDFDNENVEGKRTFLKLNNNNNKKCCHYCFKWNILDTKSTMGSNNAHKHSICLCERYILIWHGITRKIHTKSEFAYACEIKSTWHISIKLTIPVCPIAL